MGRLQLLYGNTVHLSHLIRQIDVFNHVKRGCLVASIERSPHVRPSNPRPLLVRSASCRPCPYHPSWLCRYGSGRCASDAWGSRRGADQFPQSAELPVKHAPKNAVVVPTHGVDLLYYPPRAAIAPITRAVKALVRRQPLSIRCSTALQSHFEHGELQSVWVLDPEKPALHCQYSGGVVVKPSPPPAACPAASELPFNLQKVHK